ncbi:MAG: hypothetical protein VYC39_12490 [Myxococcota bacterium]|nr:hypothetical protein [Myxococcota bacterium]
MTRTLVANLDYEFELLSKQSTLPKALLRRLGKTATILRVFSPQLLVTPFPIELNWFSEVKDLSVPRVIQSQTVPKGSEVMYWAQSKEPSNAICTDIDVASYQETAWRCPRASVVTSRRANDKVFCHDLQKQLGIELPQSKKINHIGDIEQLRDYPSWVIKSRYGVAGRNRLLGRYEANDTQRKALEKMIQQSETLILEPWMTRIQDYGVTGFLTHDNIFHVRVHILKVESQGTFSGIDTKDGSIDKQIVSVLTEAFGQIADALQKGNYIGPLGIDAFTYRGTDGRIHLHPVTEINARMTFGHVAHAYSEVFARPIELGFGESVPNEATIISAPSDSDSTNCWIV